MITPRQTRLVRAADLPAFRTTIADGILTTPPEAAGDVAVIVPTRAAAEQLRRTVEHRGLGAGGALAWPLLVTRAELYDALASRLARPLLRLSAFERDVILSAVAREAARDGLPPPFDLRPGLVAEMAELYDEIRRLGRTLDDFARNFEGELEPAQDTDRGAARLLQQTRFLVAAFRRYEARLAASDSHDEHTLRGAIAATAATQPLRRILVTVADRVADPDGLWPSDFDLLARLPGLEQLDLIATESLLGAGLLERLHAAFPDLQEVRSPSPAGRAPTLVVPRGRDGLVHAYRDREEELVALARRLKLARGGDIALDRHALVVRRPLPYLYLARHVFSDAAIPFESRDTLPLAAEPYAAAVDLALDAVASGFTRGALLGLLRSPHFALDTADSGTVSSAAIGACEFALAEARYLGGLDRLRALVTGWGRASAPASREERRQQTALPAARAALAAATALSPLALDAPMTDHVATLMAWLRRFDRPAAPDEAVRSRRLRVRAAVLGALGALGEAYARHDPDARGDVTALTAAIRRWLGVRTFATQTGSPGLQIVDAQAARYGDFDDLQIAGLIDGEWPERMRRTVFYPSSLMALLDPAPAADPGSRERASLQAARAAFRDLVFSPVTRVRLSAFTLEQDALVEPSVLLDEVPGYPLTAEAVDERPARVTFAEALALEPRRPEAVPLPAASWAAARLAPDEGDPGRFRGEAGAWTFPRVSVSRVERYQDCPFRFYASEVLRLEEQPEDEDTRTPLERGRFLHELWERFFAEWQRLGRGRVEPGQLDEARALFETLCEEALAALPPSEAALERTRLLGSAASPGIAYRVFAMEADRPTPIDERLLEYPLRGAFAFRTRDGAVRTVTLSAKADRIDRLRDGSLRVIDYKSKTTPDLKTALQLPLYSHCARESLRAERGGEFPIAEALYLSFEGEKAVVALRARGRTIDELIDDAQDRLIGALDDIARGRFPPRPAKPSLCRPCPYRTVCRLEIVEAPAEADGG